MSHEDDCLRSLALALLAAGCGTPGGDSGDNTEKAEESKKNSAKVDVAKAGDVTLTIWDQEVRGGQAKQIKQLNADFQRTYPNVTIKRVAKSFTDLNTTLKLAVSGPKAPDIVQANQGRQVMGALVTGGLLKPMDAYADAYGWNDRWSKTLLDLNRFSSDGKQFGSGDLYGVSQMGEIVGVFYNKDKVASVPKTFGEFEDMLAKAKATARSRSRSATSTSSVASTSSRPSRTLREQGRDRATSCSPSTMRASTRPRTSRRRRSSRSGPTRATSRRTSTARATTRPGSSSPRARARSRSPARGSPTTRSSAIGDKLGFFLMPGREAGSDPVSLGGESLPWAITAKSKNADVAAAYIDFITNAKAADVLVETDNLPAMAGERPALLAGQQGRLRRLEAAQRQRRPNAVHRLRDADVLRRLLGRCAAADSRQGQAGRVHEGRAGGLREVRRQAVTALAPPGEPRRIAYVYLLPGLVIFGLFVLAPLCTARGCRCSAGTG